MPKSEIFRVNYYVGAGLAHGGNIWLENSKLIFSPTSALDRAMGARDVEIPFDRINDLVFKGDLFRTFIIKTTEKVHKFEGSKAKKVWELLDMALKSGGAILAEQSPTSRNTEPAAPASAPGHMLSSTKLLCDHCAKSIEPGFSFCPSCGNRVKIVCSSCHRAIISTWIACAWCGWKFTPGGAPGK